MTVKLLTEQNFEFASLTGGCTGSSKSTLVKMPHCWKSHVAAHIFNPIVEGSPLCDFYLQSVIDSFLPNIRNSFLPNMWKYNWVI